MAILNLRTELQRGRNEFVGQTFSSDILITPEDVRSFERLTFRDCIFQKAISVDGINSNSFYLKFHNCQFDEELDILRCIVQELQVSFIKKLRSITIYGGVFSTIRIDSNNLELDGDVIIENCYVKNTLDCSKLHLSTGQFSLNLKNEFAGTSENYVTHFENSVFKAASFNSYFGRDANFRNFKILKTCVFHRCDFKKVSFEYAAFGETTQFIDCKFYSYSGFEECKGLNSTHIFFKSCLFKSFPHFNNSKFNHLEVVHSTFERKVSFDQIETNTLKFYQVTFHEVVFFDEIRINALNDLSFFKNLSLHDIVEWKRSLRLIKQELQKADNQIDYHRFKAYELDAYRMEISETKDLKNYIILFLNSYSSNHGLDWWKGVRFTLCTTIAFFSLYFAFQNFSNELHVSWKTTHSFVQEYFRFIIPTEFDYFYAKGFSNLAAILIFTLGKIALGYGIYQTVVAFRKFKI
ncbi:MAG TPA: hypothetical protein VF676_04705 [Flavobacterium sp.]